MTRGVAGGVVGAVVMACARAACAGVVFQDGAMSNADWTIESVGVGSATGSQIATGNPGTARTTTITVGPGAGNAFRAMHKFGITQGTTYDPVISGAITSIEFSIDGRAPVGTGPGQVLALAIKQGTAVYYAAATPTVLDGQWHAYSAGVTLGDFVRADGMAGAPDFSATGSRIRFGFMAMGSADASGAGFTASCDYDNFFVRVVPPGPSLAVVGLGVSGLVRRRR